MRRNTVAKTDGCTVTFTKLPDGKFNAMGGLWDREALFWTIRCWKSRFGAGQLHFPPAPEDTRARGLPPSMKDAIGWEEHG